MHTPRAARRHRHAHNLLRVRDAPRAARGPVGELVMSPFADHLRKMGVKILGG